MEHARTRGHIVEHITIIVLLSVLLVGISIGLSATSSQNIEQVGRGTIQTAFISPQATATVLSAHTKHP